MTSTVTSDLDGAVCSDGAPSARNLIVTVFGDVLAVVGPDTETTVQALTAVLADFGVNERLVRTSLTRLVNEGLLVVRPEGRRSFYRIAPEAIDLFASADERIYRGRPLPWDGSWTLVVLDGAESTPERRAALRHELSALGLGVVAPNVMGSPIVAADAAAAAVASLGGFEQVLVTRSTPITGSGLADQAGLARRCLALDDLEQAYCTLADRLARFDDRWGLEDARAAKLRLLVVSTFRRLVLADPMLPAALLPDDWAGDRARREAGRLYTAASAAADRHLGGLLGVEVTTPPNRFSTI
ncbi:MAG: PaaX family transcriptional regulator C-terminal domain-containing protein [Ilumatobacteraceae bacterium]